MSLFDSILDAGEELVRLPLSVAATALALAREIELEGRRRTLDALDDAFLAAVDMVLARVLSDDVVDRALTLVEETGVAQHVTERLLDDGIAEQLATAMEGPLVEEAVAQLLANEALWVLVDEIAQSPSVTAAISHQGTGFFEEVAERARDRSRNADARLERIARRIGRRRPPRDTGDAPAPGPPAPEPGLG